MPAPLRQSVQTEPADDILLLWVQGGAVGSLRSIAIEGRVEAPQIECLISWLVELFRW